MSLAYRTLGAKWSFIKLEWHSHRKDPAMTKKFAIEMPSLTEIVAQRVRQAIIDGEFALGQMISEETLAESFGVGARRCATHSPCRPRGWWNPLSYVFQPDEADVQAICDFRAMLELHGATLSRAADREATLAALREAQAQMEAAAAADDDVAYGHGDSVFHEAFFSQSGNPYVVNSYALVSGKIAALRANMARQFSNARDVSLQEHRAMVACVDAGDFASWPPSCRPMWAARWRPSASPTPPPSTLLQPPHTAAAQRRRSLLTTTHTETTPMHPAPAPATAAHRPDRDGPRRTRRPHRPAGAKGRLSRHRGRLWRHRQPPGHARHRPADPDRDDHPRARDMAPVVSSLPTPTPATADTVQHPPHRARIHPGGVSEPARRSGGHTTQRRLTSRGLWAA